MTTGKKFQFRGHGPGQRIDRLRKEIELIDLEAYSHREMLARLRYVQEFVLLTGEQARAVAGEVAWRKEELRRLSNVRHTKVTGIAQWGCRLEEARMRSTTSNHQPAPQSRASDCNH